MLSDLDTQMATLYGVRMQIPMLMGARGAAQDEQRAWLAERRACGGDVACIVQSYQQRIAELKQTISRGDAGLLHAPRHLRLSRPRGAN